MFVVVDLLTLKDFQIIWLSIHLSTSLPDEGHPKKTSCVLYQIIYVFIFILMNMGFWKRLLRNASVELHVVIVTYVWAVISTNYDRNWKISFFGLNTSNYLFSSNPCHKYIYIFRPFVVIWMLRFVVMDALSHFSPFWVYRGELILW